MRTFLFQCSTLMMVTLMYSSPIHNCRNKVLCRCLLNQIKQGALNLSTKAPKDVWVPNISTWDKDCAPKFFCLAEKVVQTITDMPNNETWSRLHQNLVGYNNQTNASSCKVESNSRYLLPAFLENVVLCVDHVIMNRRAIA